ncbi:MAG: type III-B CRISPR module RAMP protein Cmr4 [Armatimonadetes bacterium]|nr:type III-B CRISPR module RAMP protein Cmr4 [Armatimonadota bacterium]
MKTAMLGLLAETPIHPGTGRAMGVVDLPVARESATDYPVLVGSSLKGALRDKAGSTATEEVQNHRFGTPDQAGDLLVSDGRLLLLPVRSLTGSYRWVTCQHLIERYRRDLSRTGLTPRPQVPDVARGSAHAAGSGSLFLEERQFAIDPEHKPETGLVESIAPLVLHEDTRRRLGSRIAILNDCDFAWFARYGLSVQARNVLEDGTKKSKNLWYEETLPPDTVMYALILGRSDDALRSLDVLFPEKDPYLQAGGNETVGQGWFAVSVRRADDRGDL